MVEGAAAMTEYLIESEPHMVFLIEQQAACRMALRRAYREYFSRLAGQVSGDADVIDAQQIHPLEAEYVRLTASLAQWMVQREAGV